MLSTQVRVLPREQVTVKPDLETNLETFLDRVISSEGIYWDQDRFMIDTTQSLVQLALNSPKEYADRSIIAIDVVDVIRKTYGCYAEQPYITAYEVAKLYLNDMFHYEYAMTSANSRPRFHDVLNTLQNLPESPFKQSLFMHLAAISYIYENYLEYKDKIARPEYYDYFLQLMEQNRARIGLLYPEQTTFASVVGSDRRRLEYLNSFNWKMLAGLISFDPSQVALLDLDNVGIDIIDIRQKILSDFSLTFPIRPVFPEQMVKILSHPLLQFLARHRKYDEIRYVCGFSQRQFSETVKYWRRQGLVPEDLSLSLTTWVKYTQFWSLISKYRKEIGVELPERKGVPSFKRSLISLSQALYRHIYRANLKESKIHGRWVWPLEDHLYRLYPEELGLSVSSFEVLERFFSDLRDIIKGLNINTTAFFGEQTQNSAFIPFLRITKHRMIKALTIRRRSPHIAALFNNNRVIEPFNIKRATIEDIVIYMTTTLRNRRIIHAAQFPISHSKRFQSLFRFTDGAVISRLSSELEVTPFELYRRVVSDIDPEYKVGCEFFLDTDLSTAMNFAQALARYHRNRDIVFNSGYHPKLGKFVRTFPPYPGSRVISLSRNRNSYRAFCADKGYSLTNVLDCYKQLQQSSN